MADVHFYLPELKVDKKITPPARTGLWKNDAKTIIRGISDAIVVGEGGQGVSSIPDIWARPLMFQNFLFSVYKKLDPNSEKKQPLTLLEEKTFREWKGLLSILALSKTKLSFERIEIIPFSPVENDRFCKALSNLSPNPVMIEKGKEYLWKNILLIRYNGVPVGAFSPSTLVYAGSDYNGDFRKKFASGAGRSSIVLDEKGYLCPPSKENDLRAVGEWVRNIKRKLDNLFNTRDESRETDRILATMNSVLLQIWLDEIASQLNIDVNEVESSEVKVSEQIAYFEDRTIPEFIENYRIYNWLLHPLETDTAAIGISHSDIELKSARNLFLYNNKEIKHVLLITDKLYADDCRIWNQLRYTALGNNYNNILSSYFSSEAGQEIKGKDIALANDGVLWIRPELFFLSDTLLTSSDEKTFLSQKEENININSKYVLPFKKQLLDFFNADEIKELLKPKYDDKGDRVIFSFTLPVIGNENGIEIKKVYRKKNAEKGEGIILNVEIPVLEIFPDYLGENWRKYFLLQSHVEKFSVHPIIHGDVKRNERLTTVQNEKNKIKIIELKGENSFPEGIEINSHKNEPIGIILLDKYLNREKSDALRNRLEIGIDFGTSNTNVYFKEENSEGKRWCYEFPKYIRMLTSSQEDFRNSVLSDSFIPSREHLLPIPTALLNKYATQDAPVLLLDYFIFFNKNENDYFIPKNVYSNLKWDQENGQEVAGRRKDNINNTDWFIECLLFLVFLEVTRKNCSEVMINCTFPKAFSQDDRTRFGRYWEMALEKLLRSQEKILNVYDEEKESEYNLNKTNVIGPYLMTEGIAAGYFFANPTKFTTTKNIEKANLADGAICIDVGGGTTDISIWFDNGSKAFYDTSIILAGKQISDFIRLNNEISKNLFSSSGADALKEKKESDSTFAAVLNLILKAEEKSVYNNLAKSSSNSSIQALFRIILLEFGAFAYYTALLCKAAVNKPEGKGLLEKIEQRGMNLYWGGNGSKFISWLGYGRFTSDSTCVKFLNNVFFYGLKLHGINPNSNIVQFSSPEPKSEACGGIIVSEISQRENSTATGGGNASRAAETGGILELDMEILQQDAAEDLTPSRISKEFIIGEKIELTDGKVIQSHESVTDKELFLDNKTLVKNITLSELENFIKVLNKVALSLGLLKEGNQIVLTNNIKAKLQSNLLDIFKNLQGKSPDKRRLEPVFVLEVKDLMHLIQMNIV